MYVYVLCSEYTRHVTWTDFDTCWIKENRKKNKKLVNVITVLTKIFLILISPQKIADTILKFRVDSLVVEITRRG